MKQVRFLALAALVLAGLPFAARADVIEFGNENLLGTGTYPTDPKAGATLQGLAPGVVTAATNSFGHTYPFSPAAGDFPGTDQIYVGSVQTASHDGYSVAPERINGPDVLSLDYSSIVPSGQAVSTFTLGIAFDDFQFPDFGNPFTVKVNGVVNAPLTTLANSLNQTGPVTQFFTIGLDPSILSSSDVLSLSIDEGGDGGDGYALDYLTVGVTTVPVAGTPLPASLNMGLLGMLGIAGFSVVRRRQAVS